MEPRPPQRPTAMSHAAPAAAAAPAARESAPSPFAGTPAAPLLWAHRGASADAPENTLAAFRLAREQGAEGIELDAQLCAGGEVAVIHDATLGRTAGVPGLVSDCSLQRLRSLDAGRWKGERFAGERIPLLAEVLEALPGLRVNVELKCEEPGDRGLTERVLAVVREARAEERVLLSSFNPLCLRRARRLAPAIERALLFEPGGPWLLRSAASAPLLAPRALHPHSSLVTKASAARWLRRGYRLACWTVDDES
jgi:glycerophosphoryl diester phosphodiesterase